MNNLKLAPSAVRLLFYYCARADQDTGETNVSAERSSQDLGIRKDHIDEHDRKLVRDGYIAIAKNEYGGRIIHMLSPWTPRSERSGHLRQASGGKDTSQVLGNNLEQSKDATQSLGSALDSFPKLGETPQNLGKSPKTWGVVSQNLGESSQNLGKTSQNLGAHIGITSPCNQPMGTSPDIPASPEPAAKHPRVKKL